MSRDILKTDTYKRIINSTSFLILIDALNEIFIPENIKLIIEKVYSDHKEEGESIIDFYVRLRNAFKESISKKFILTNHEDASKELGYFDKKKIALFRVKIDEISKKFNSNLANTFSENFLVDKLLLPKFLTYMQILNCSDERLFTFMNYIEVWAQEKLKQIDLLMYDDETKEHLRDLYQSGDLCELAPIFVLDAQLQGKGNFLFDLNYTPNNTSEYKYLKALQTLNNLVETLRLHASNDIDQNHFFNGIHFSDITAKDSSIWIEEVQESKLIKALKSEPQNMQAIQSKIAYPDKEVLSILSLHKKPLAFKEYQVEDKIIRYELYSDTFGDVGSTQLLPLYLKQSITSTETPYFVYSLYVISNDSINTATQIIRLEKDLGDFHKQKGGEVIPQSVHIHLGNMINQLMTNDKNKGHFDIHKNYIFESALTSKQYESIFDMMCSIEKHPTKTIEQWEHELYNNTL